MSLIYVKKFSDNLLPNIKLFTDDSYFFSINHNINTWVNFLKGDFDKISDWLFNRKLDLTLTQRNKPKLWKIIHPLLF